MKKTLLILLCMFWMISCVNKQGNSTIGNWDNSQIETCKNEISKLFGNDERLTTMLDFYKISKDQYLQCYCEEIEKTYSSWDEAGKKMVDPSEHTKIQQFCFPNTNGSDGSPKVGCRVPGGRCLEDHSCCAK